MATAFIAFAVQADVSIGGTNPAVCGDRSVAVRGRMTSQAALRRLLSASACTFAYIDPRAVRIEPRPVSRPAPAPRPETAIAPVEAVIVTATRTPDRLQDTPYDVSVISGARIEREGLTDLGRLAARISGLSETNLGPGRDKFLIRGLSDGVFTGRTQSTVGLYLDDTPITYDAPDPDLRLIDLARVEVLKGPQGATYGSGSIGGIVRLVTQRPVRDQWSAAASAERSWTRGGGPSSALTLVLNAPLPAGAVRVAAYREAIGGYVEDVPIHVAQANRTSRTGARLAADLDLTNGWRLQFGAAVQSLNADDTQYSSLGLGPYQRQVNVREPHDNDFGQISATVIGDLAGGELSASLAQVRHQLQSRYDATDAADALALPPGLLVFDDRRKIDLTVAEAVWRSNPTLNWRGLAGVYYANSRDIGSSGLTTAAATVALDERRTDRLDETALFGELTHEFSPALDLTAGGRLFWSRVAVDAQVRRTLPPAAGARLDDKTIGYGFAPKVVLRYQPTPAVTLHLQASEGYRAPGFNTGGLLAGSQADTRFKADELWNLEAGVKRVLFDGRLALRATAYHAVWKGVQSDQFLASGLPVTVNVGDGANNGLEVEADWAVTPRLRAYATVLVDDPQLTRVASGFTGRADAGLPGAPGQTANLGFEYRRVLAQDVVLGLSTNWSYVGPSHLTFDAVSTSRMGGYVDGEIAGSLAVGKVTVAAFVTNPSQRIGDTFAFGNPFSVRTLPQKTPLRPMTAGVRLSAAF